MLRDQISAFHELIYHSPGLFYIGCTEEHKLNVFVDSIHDLHGICVHFVGLNDLIAFIYHKVLHILKDNQLLFGQIIQPTRSRYYDIRCLLIVGQLNDVLL